MSPVLAPPVVAGPVVTGPVVDGAVLAGAVFVRPVLAAVGCAAAVLAGMTLAGLALTDLVRARVPGLGGARDTQGGRGTRNRHRALGCGGQWHGEQGRRGARHHAGPGRPGSGPRELPVPPPQAAQDGQHPAAAPGVGPGDRYARIRERGAHLLILVVAGH